MSIDQLRVSQGLRVDTDWTTLKLSKSQQIEQWADLLKGDDGLGLRSDTAKVQALRHLQRCEDELDRLGQLERIDLELRDSVDVAKARADLAALEGSHGPSMQWLKLSVDLEDRARKLAEMAEQRAKEVAEPDAELRQLAQALLNMPQGALAELVTVLQAGKLPEDWTPSLALAS